MSSMQTHNVIAVDADTSPLNSISTEGIRASERRDFWQSRTSPLFGFYQLEMQNKETFNARFEYTSVADLIFCRLSAYVPHRVIRKGGTAQRDDRGLVKAVLQMSG